MYEKSNIYLIGFMGTGKSAAAKYLECSCSMRRIDMDEEIVHKEGRSISDIFLAEGEAFFRTLEQNLLSDIAGMEHTVVSCGGGTAMKKENVEMMRKSGIVVLLTASPKTICRRICRDTSRPLLHGNLNEAYISNMMEQRKTGYEEAADVVISTENKDIPQVCRNIISEVKRMKEHV